MINMELYITHCVAGFLAFNDDLKLIDYELFDDDNIDKLIKIENREVLPEELNLIERNSNYETINIESLNRLSDYDIPNVNININSINKSGEYLRENLKSILTDIGFIEPGEYPGKINNIHTKLANIKMKNIASGDDKLLIQAINSIEDIDESISKIIERFREWYIIYFPEIESVNNNEIYIKLIAEGGKRENIITNNPEYFTIESDESNGADIEEDDLIILNNFVKSIYELQKSREEIINYINTKMIKIAPNLTDLVGASLGAKLISHGGGLKNLALYPASTIQIMGAEKALFRHMKTGDRPPKHGLIYQHPKIRSCKWWNRGKISRILALKISLAVKRDYFIKEFNPRINIDFEEEVEAIEKNNPFPKRNKKNRENKKPLKDGKKKKKKRRKRRK